MKNEVKKHRLTFNINWLGFVPHHEMITLYSKYDGIILPSRSESFGMVALEALSHGIPLASTRAGGLSQFVNSNVAEVIPKINRNDIAKATINMLRNKVLTKARVQQGEKIALEYSWSKISDRYITLMENLVKRRAFR